MTGREGGREGALELDGRERGRPGPGLRSRGAGGAGPSVRLTVGLPHRTGRAGADFLRYFISRFQMDSVQRESRAGLGLVSQVQLGGTGSLGFSLHPALHPWPCTALHCTALHCTALHCTALHCTALHCTALHCTAPHCTALH
jgi:hypothetical protein